MWRCAILKSTARDMTSRKYNEGVLIRLDGEHARGEQPLIWAMGTTTMDFVYTMILWHALTSSHAKLSDDVLWTAAAEDEPVYDAF